MVVFPGLTESWQMVGQDPKTAFEDVRDHSALSGMGTSDVCSELGALLRVSTIG